MAEAFQMFQEALSETGLKAQPEASVDILGKLGELVNSKFELEETIAKKEAEVKALKDELAEYNTVKIPELLEAAGLSEITTKDGYKVKTELKYRGSISEADKDKALEWFIASGGADTIKNSYIIPISIADKDVAKNLEQLLTKVGLSYSNELKIAWNTLAGVIKDLDVNGSLENNQVFEKLRKENNWPEDLTLSKVLGVYKTKDTKVVKKKSK